jgi:AcrR family transcriptional regulator
VPHIPAWDQPSHSRSRRVARPSGEDREAAILVTAERLLRERPLHEISIDELTRTVGISRPAFYFYFPSKDAVLLTLLDRVMTASFDAAGRNYASDSDDPTQQWRHAIEAGFRTFSAHRAVVVAAAQAKVRNPEVRKLWNSILQRWLQRTIRAIEAERRRGASPPGIPAKDLAIALNLMNERAMLAVLAADQPALAESNLVDVLTQVWINAIYLTPNPPRFNTLPIANIQPG